MCGRFTQTQSSEIIAQVFELENVPELTPRYNIAPTQPVATVIVTAEDKKRQFQMLRWGLIPSWAKDSKMAARLINARAETVTEKPAFRSAFRKRRCLVIADGFYEWQQLQGKKQPFYFRLSEGEPFAFAGLWEHWQNQDGETITSCTLLTTEANQFMSPIHNRMPVILQPKDYALWLDPEIEKLDLLKSLLQPYSEEGMTCYAVDRKVNSPKNDSSECITPEEKF